MKAGRELDILVAELMGCNVRRSKATGFAYCGCKDNRHGDNEIGLIRYYSTDNSVTLQVIEEMRRRYDEVSLQCLRNHQWYFTIVTANADIYTGVADTAPLAVCLGSLKAVGVVYA